MAAAELEIDLQYLDENGYLKETAVKRDNQQPRCHSIDSGEVMRHSPNGQSSELHQDVAVDNLPFKQQLEDDTIECAFGNMTEDEHA